MPIRGRGVRHLALSAGTVPAFTASFGVARAGEGETLEEVCRAADVALFRAKREGRNRVMVDEGLAGPEGLVAEVGTDGGA